MLQPKIKIFWDLSAYNNQKFGPNSWFSNRNFSSSVIATCPVPSPHKSVVETLKDVRVFTSNFGVVTSIKAYWDRNKLQPADDTLYAAMPSMGINLVDCSTMQGYTDDALTKMLSGEEACIILVSYH